MNNLKKISKLMPGQLWIILGIIVIGIFLRGYNFHAWLDFGSDQVNDATRVGAVVQGLAPWPAYGPDMGNSGTGGRSQRFKLGPIYYDAEIISAKLFGNNPVSMAYPDLLFSILSLPLFYLFLRKIFDANLALSLTGLYAVSYYALSFSHSAWNVNSIPFFSLLFLLSTYELILSKEKTHWGWVFALGITLGISVQLHAILLVLFPAVLFFVSLLWLRKNVQMWKKLGAIILLAIILNSGQIIGELHNNFKNSKIFLASITGSSTSGGDSPVVKAANNLSCNFQANTYMLSAIGNSDCDFTLSQFMSGGGGGKKLAKSILQAKFIFKVIICLSFSILGYGLLIGKFRREQISGRRYFLGLIMLYVISSFFVMLPVIDTAIRYFVHLFFLPFLLLGLGVELLMRRYGKRYLSIVLLLFAFFVASNIFAIYLQIRDDFVQTRIILGPVESMVDYMIADSNNQKEIYLFSDTNANDYFKSLAYAAAQKKVVILRAGDKDDVPKEKTKFYLSTGTWEEASMRIKGRSFDSHKVFDQVTLFHLVN